MLPLFKIKILDNSAGLARKALMLAMDLIAVCLWVTLLFILSVELKMP